MITLVENHKTRRPPWQIILDLELDDGASTLALEYETKADVLKWCEIFINGMQCEYDEIVDYVKSHGFDDYWPGDGQEIDATIRAIKVTNILNTGYVTTYEVVSDKHEGRWYNPIKE